MFKLRYLFIFLLSVSFFTNVMAGEKKLIKIGAGNIMEGNYSIALGLCRYISSSNPGLDCEVISTLNSLDNIDLLRREEVDFAIIQSNIAIDAYKGEGYFIDKGPFNEMQQLINLYDSVFTVVVRDDAQIFVFKDLEGRKISNGPERSDSTVAYKALEAFYDFKKPVSDIEISPEYYARDLCDKKVDGIMMMTGHPNALVNLIANSCNVEFISLDEDKVDALLKNNSAFHKKVMRAGLYPRIDNDQISISAPVILVSTTKADPKIVQNLLDYISNHVDDFRLFHPVLYDFNNEYFQKDFVLPNFDSTKEVDD